MNQRLVIAVIMKGDEILAVADNRHECKRVGMPTGQGYELCEGCDYANHAEQKALRNAFEKYSLEELKEATLFLLGHSYACYPCQGAIGIHGLKLVIISAS